MKSRPIQHASFVPFSLENKEEFRLGFELLELFPETNIDFNVDEVVSELGRFPLEESAGANRFLSLAGPTV